MGWLVAEGEGGSHCFGGSEGAEEGDAWGGHDCSLVELKGFFTFYEICGLGEMRLVLEAIR